MTATQETQAAVTPIGFAITSLILGLIAAILFWVPLAGFVLGLPAVAVGIVALQRGQNRAMATFGVTTGAIGVAANIGLLIIAAVMF